MERLRRFFLPAKGPQGLLLNIYLITFFYYLEIGLIISSTNQNYERQKRFYFHIRRFWLPGKREGLLLKFRSS